MAPQLVILAADAAREDLHAHIVAVGGRVSQAYGSRVWIVDVPEGTELPDDLEGYPGQVPDDVGAALDDETCRLGISAWNVRHSASFAATRANRVGDGRSWGDEGVDPEG
jgi:hypothetical protein